MDSLSMEKVMLKNMVEKTGKSIDEWITIVRKTEFDKHSGKVRYLKENYSLTHGYANLIVNKSK